MVSQIYLEAATENDFKKRGARIEYVLDNYEASPEGEIRKDLDVTC